MNSQGSLSVLSLLPILPLMSTLVHLGPFFPAGYSQTYLSWRDSLIVVNCGLRAAHLLAFVSTIASGLGCSHEGLRYDGELSYAFTAVILMTYPLPLCG